MKKILVILISIQLIYTNSIFSQHNFEDFFQKKKSETLESEIEKKTKKCTKYIGLFNFYQDKENINSYVELTPHILVGNLFIYYIENSVSNYAMKGSYRGSKIIKINKYYDKIEFTIENTKFILTQKIH